MTLKADERIREHYSNECLAVEQGVVCEFKLHHDGPHSWQLPMKPQSLAKFASGLQLDEDDEFTA